MEVLSALLCDAAEDYHGKLCIMGAFDTLMSRDFPVIHPHCAIALRMLFRTSDEGAHEFRIRLIDSDGGTPIPEISAGIEVEIPEELFFLSRNLVINIQGLPLASPGQYSFDIRMDEAMVARIPLQAVEMHGEGDPEWMQEEEN